MFPWYLAIGMPADQFWNGDAWLVEGYREAYKLRNQRKSEEFWLQGLYVYHAVGVVVGNALAKKGATPLKYLDEPIRVIPYTEEEQAARAEKERQKAVDYFNRLAKKMGGEAIG